MRYVRRLAALALASLLLAGVDGCGGSHRADNSAAARATRANYHQSDTNNDGSIKIDELTAYIQAWKLGTYDDINLVTNAISIWKGGEAYHYDSSVTPPYVAGAGGGGQNLTNTGVVSGRVRDPAGTAIGSVSVAVGTATTTTNEQGYFVLGSVSPGSGQILSASKSGYTTAIKPVNVVNGDNTFVDLVMKQIGVTQTINAGVSNTITDTRSDGRNGSITIPAGGITTRSNRQVTSATVSLTTLLPSDTSFGTVFPGSFEGRPTGGTIAVAIRSYGVVDVTIRDAQGNLLQLASGKPSELVFPIDPAHDPGVATVPLWYLDTTTGKWVQEGVLTRDTSVTPAVYRGSVAHLTPWNCDQTMNTSTKEVRVRGLGGAPVSNARVVINGTGYQATGYTNSDGVASLSVQANDSISVTVSKGTLSVGPTTETAGAAGTTKVNTIDLVPPIVTVMMSWGARPSDLDAHMTGPIEGAASAATRFHVYYSSKGSLAVSPFCLLDTDDTSSYGPEIISVSKLITGVYRYSVHNYDGQAAGPIESSGCTVTLVAPGVLRRYDVPTTNSSNRNTWQVFDLTATSATTVTVTDLNSFADYSAGSVPRKVK